METEYRRLRVLSRRADGPLLPEPGDLSLGDAAHDTGDSAAALTRSVGAEPTSWSIRRLLLPHSAIGLSMALDDVDSGLMCSTPQQEGVPVARHLSQGQSIRPP